MKKPVINLIDYFMDLPDPRLDRRRLHSLTDILCITICAVICGAQRLYADVELYFQKPGAKCQSTELEIEKGHGRLETRRYWLSNQIEWLEQKSEWKGLNAIGMVESTREIRGEQSIERRYYLTNEFFFSMSF